MSSLTQSEIAALKVGDEIGIDGYGAWSTVEIAKVERRTATQIVVGNAKFNKSGRRVGDSGSYSSRYLISVDEARERITHQQAERARNQRKNYLRNYSYGNLTDAQLKAVTDLLKSYTKQEEPA